VTFTPTVTGTRSGIVSITSNATETPAEVTLSGSGVPLLGSSSAAAALSADALMQARPDAPSGVYWFDPDGADGQAPFESYADLTKAGGGWIQVRRVRNSGGWYPGNDDLAGTEVLSIASLAVANADANASRQFDYFVDANTEYLFATGDSSIWCVIKRGGSNFNAFTTENVNDVQTPVLYSMGTQVTSGGNTGILLRTAPVFNEEPWIGCEGGHLISVQTRRMLYGENNFASPPFVDLKNDATRNGIIDSDINA
jgi:hypothetical protein